MERFELYPACIIACVVSLIPYFCFRTEVYNLLHGRGIRTKEIYRRMNGPFKLLWYLRVAQDFSMRPASVLSIIWTSLWLPVTLYVSVFGWWEAIPSLALCIPMAVLMAATSAILGYTVVNRNIRLFESPFVLFCALRVRNQRGNFLNTAYYSVILDFILMLLPVAAAVFLFFL